MARRAVWRALPDDPRTPLGWFLTDGGACGLPPWAVGALALSVATLALAWSPWLLSALPLLLLQMRLPRPPRDLARFETVPPPGPSFACRLDVRRGLGAYCDSALLGTDEGVVTLLDGWLHYVGERTEFALRPAEATSWGGYGESSAMFLGDEHLVFTPLRSLGEPIPSAELSRRFFRIFHDWSRATPAVEGEPILPPQAVHPTGMVDVWRAALAVVAFYLAAIPAAFLLSQGGGWIVCVSGGLSRLPFRRLHRLRRLAREERVLPAGVAS